MAEDRRKRLKLLKARKEAAGGGDTATGGGGGEDEDEEKPVVTFRNYTPNAEALRENKLEGVQLPEVEAAVEEALAVGAAPLDAPLNIAPKKPDWDLKRDVEKRMSKLHRRTQRAIVDLIRQRLEQEAAEASGGEEDE